MKGYKISSKIQFDHLEMSKCVRCVHLQEGDCVDKLTRVQGVPLTMRQGGYSEVDNTGRKVHGVQSLRRQESTVVQGDQKQMGREKEMPTTEELQGEQFKLELQSIQ